jgi:hypothetical protein
MFPIGVFQDFNKPGFFEEYEKLVNRLIGPKDSVSTTKKQKVVEK